MVKISDFLEKVFDFLFPPTCPLCGEGVSKDGNLCTICWPSFNWIDGQKCCKCGIPLAESDELMCGSCLADKCGLDPHVFMITHQNVQYYPLNIVEKSVIINFYQML